MLTVRSELGDDLFLLFLLLLDDINCLRLLILRRLSHDRQLPAEALRGCFLIQRVGILLEIVDEPLLFVDVADVFLVETFGFLGSHSADRNDVIIGAGSGHLGNQRIDLGTDLFGISVGAEIKVALHASLLLYGEVLELIAEALSEALPEILAGLLHEFEQKIDISEQNTYFNQTHILPPLNSSRSGLPNKKARPLDRIGLMFQKRPSENESHKDRSHDSGPDFLQDDSAAEQKLKALAGSALGRYDRVILDHDVVVLI